jgi:hypothetical protein
MEVNMIKHIIRYLENNVQDHIEVHKWKKAKNLIYRFQDNFNFYEIYLLGIQIVLIEENGPSTNIKEMYKLMKMVKRQEVDYCAMVFKDITSYKRKKMIQERIPFIIENGQMYLPFLGLDLSFTTKKESIKPTTFTPSAQLLFLYLLYNKSQKVDAEYISSLFQASKVHASRALRELYDMKLITYEIGGSTNRTRIYKRINDPEYYQQGYKYLKNPVQSEFLCTCEARPGMKSGLSALSEQSMLGEPEHETYAITKDERNHLVHNIDIIYDDESAIMLEVWSYDPTIISKGKYVDIVSLHLSLRDIDDPRIDEEIEKMMKGETWYKV